MSPRIPNDVGIPGRNETAGYSVCNWYNNGVEIPVDEAEAKVYWDKNWPMRENLRQHISF